MAKVGKQQNNPPPPAPFLSWCVDHWLTHVYVLPFFSSFSTSLPVLFLPPFRPHTWAQNTKQRRTTVRVYVRCMTINSCRTSIGTTALAFLSSLTHFSCSTFDRVYHLLRWFCTSHHITSQSHHRQSQAGGRMDHTKMNKFGVWDWTCGL